MAWVGSLQNLPVIVAVLVVFTFCLLGVVRYISKHVVEPFKIIIGNHLNHLTAEQKEDRIERGKMREALSEQTKAIGEQSATFRELCYRLKDEA